MTGNSVILTEYDANSTSDGQFIIKSTGCSEYIAHAAGLKRYTTLCFELLNTTNSGAYCKATGLSPIEYMEAWVRFVYEALACLNVAQGSSFTSLYTFGDLLGEKNFNVAGQLSNCGISLSGNQVAIGGHQHTLTPETVIGIMVDVKALRAHFKYKYYDNGKLISNGYPTDQARKVQLIHTALRYGWSNAYRVGITALNLSKLVPNADKFQILQISYYLNNIFNKNTYEFGTLYQNENSQLITKEEFLRNWKDKKKSGVQVHFTATKDPILSMLGIEFNKDMTTLSSFDGKKIALGDIMNPTQEFANYIEKWIVDNDRVGLPMDINIKFKFVKTIFKATVEKMPYDGFKKPGKTIDRIVFRDEEGTILSIAQKSKLIEIL